MCFSIRSPVRLWRWSGYENIEVYFCFQHQSQKNYVSTFTVVPIKKSRSFHTVTKIVLPRWLQDIVARPLLRFSFKKSSLYKYSIQRFLSCRHLYTGLEVGLTISSSRSLRFLPLFCTNDALKWLPYSETRKKWSV